jgi:signal transduction histidine kinase
MKSMILRLKETERSAVVLLAFVFAGIIGISVFLGFYFTAYRNAYVESDIYNLSDEWEYETHGEAMTLSRILDKQVPDAAIKLRANHQSVSVYLDDAPLYTGPVLKPGENPGITPLIIPLPEGYAGKTLKILVSSPYPAFSGWLNPVLLGPHRALITYAQSEPLRPLVTMIVCLAVWIPISVISFVRKPGGGVRKELLAIGIFAMFWAMYYICNEYDVLPFLTPEGRSVFTMSVYVAQLPPLALYFYFAFERYKRQMLPAVIAHCAFTLTALVLQFTGLADMAGLLLPFDFTVLALLYTIALTVLEARAKNRLMKLTAPFFIIAYVFLAYSFYAFYTRRGVISQSFRDAYFLLISAILIYSIWHFFRDIYRQKLENEMLSLQKRSAEHVELHLHEAESLRHEIKNHFGAMRAYLEHGKLDDALDYISRCTGQSAAVMEAALSEHFIINAVAGYLCQRAKEQGVNVTLKLNATPERIANNDLYSLMSNITNNALEACAAMPAEAERFIRLSVSIQEPYFYIVCENSKHGETVSADGKIQTSKKEAGHGYGLRTVERIVEAYDGMMEVRHNENTFIIKAMLKDK